MERDHDRIIMRRERLGTGAGIPLEPAIRLQTGIAHATVTPPPASP